jgi:hypothetical protein
MKASKIFTGLLLGLALLLATSAFASNKGSLAVTDSCTVGGTHLAAGDYKVSWDGNGPDVQLSIMKGHSVVATVPAHMVELSNSPQRDSAIVSSNSDGSKSISEIRFSGKKYALSLADNRASNSNSNESSKQ